LIRAGSLEYPESPGRSVRPRPDGYDPGYAIGVRVHHDGLIGLLLDFDGTAVDLAPPATTAPALSRKDLHADLEGTDIETVVAGITAVTRELLDARRDLGTVLGLGVSIGGHVDGEAGVVRFSPDLGWSGEVRLAERLKASTGFEVVVVENDVNVLVDAEQWSGTAGRYRRFAVVKVGTGIGCGLSLHRGLERGATGAAGELGHVPFQRNGERCVCGNRGCLQTVASADAIVRVIRERGEHAVDTIEVAADLARGGDQLARRSFERAGRALGIGLAILLNLVNLEAVILCGDAALLKYEPYIDATRASLERHAFSTTAEDCDLLLESRTDELEARGAASMALGRSADLMGGRLRE
jgi:predicted NBD/HSP70 family sugar kinase